MNRRTLLRTAGATVVVTACGSSASTSGGTATKSPNPTPLPAGGKATVELANGGSFTFTLRADKAPQTVGRFVEKSRSGFYNDKLFHRVEDWVVQGGDPLGNGTGGARVPSEYNDLPFVLGAVGIARGQEKAFNNDSQWFIVKRDSQFLNNEYTNFGLVTSGMEVVSGIKIGDKIKTIKIE